MVKLTSSLFCSFCCWRFCLYFFILSFSCSCIIRASCSSRISISRSFALSTSAFDLWSTKCQLFNVHCISRSTGSQATLQVTISLDVDPKGGSHMQHMLANISLLNQAHACYYLTVETNICRGGQRNGWVFHSKSATKVTHISPYKEHITLNPFNGRHMQRKNSVTKTKS